MCAPMVIAAAATAVSMVSTVANYFGTQSAHHSAVQAANLNYNMKAQQVERQNVQLSEQQSEGNVTNAVELAKGFGRIAASSSALGLGRSSTGQLLNANAAGYNRALGINDRNYANKRTDLQTDLTGASIQRSSAIAAAPKTNLGMLALGLAGNAVQGAGLFGALGGKFGITPAGGPAAVPGLENPQTGAGAGWS